MTYQYIELKKMFGRRQPSVSRFNKLVKNLPVEERERCYRLAYFVAMNEWHVLPVWYKNFLIHLVKHDWQSFTDWLRGRSVLSDLAYPLDSDCVKQLMHLVSRLPRNDTPAAEGRISFNHLAFIAVIGFGLSGKNRVWASRIRTAAMTPEEMLDWLGKGDLIP